MSIVTVDLKRRAVNLQEAADMLAVSKITVRRAIRNGMLRAFRFGSRGSYRITIDEIENFMERSIASTKQEMTEIQDTIELKENVN